MMEPLSKRRRLFYFFSFILIFFALIPVVVLYSDGYHFGAGGKLEQTGGIYVYGGEAGARIYMDGVLQKETNSFSRSAYISTLAAGSYNISVTKEGRQSWNKTMKVSLQKVTEGYPFLLPTQISMATVTPSSTSYKSVTALFASPSRSSATQAPKVATSSTTTVLEAISKKNIDLSKEGDTIYALWLAGMKDIPADFCGEDFIDSSCVPKLAVITQKGITSYDFYPGRNDLIIFAKTDGIYVTELDTRLPHNTELLMKGTGLDFRVQNGQDVYVKNKKGIYKLEL
jgi:hypothetical protein